MKVIKRNGRTEELDISKIKKYTNEAVFGLSNVSLSELEVDAKIQFRDMITTEEIQQTLIKTAVDKIDIDRPNWTFVAARLFLFDLYHKVTGFNGYNHLKDYLAKGEKVGRITFSLHTLVSRRFMTATSSKTRAVCLSSYHSICLWRSRCF